jgi:hypothetical protein
MQSRYGADGGGEHARVMQAARQHPQGNERSNRLLEGLGCRDNELHPECFDPIEHDPWFIDMQRDL